MTPNRRHEFFWDILAGSSALLAFESFVVLDRTYHGNLGATLEVLAVPSYLITSWVVLAILGMNRDLKPFISRSWLWVCLFLGLYLRYGAVLLNKYELPLVASSALLWTVAGYGLVMYSSARIWAGLRRVTTVIPWLIVITPLAFGLWLAPQSLIWLGQPTGRPASNIATVVLLFDEMNSGATQGLQNILIQKGLAVSFKPVLPAHGSTTEVIPALFSGADFKGAGVCGVGAVCTEHSALAFDQIRVRRSDVDLVGFHHPYCYIVGLRYCARLTFQRSIWDIKWECAPNRLFGIGGRVIRDSCIEATRQIWTDMQDRSIQAVMEAPALKTGGILYAHLAMPHPPGRGAGSLADQYLQGIKQTEAVLRRILDRLEKNKLEPRILIFSDHPLRQSMWCANAAAQFEQPCVVNPLLQDDHVPLIVAGKSDLPAIENVQSNKEVFLVLSQWLLK